jgi:hypothetical protein
MAKAGVIESSRDGSVDFENRSTPKQCLKYYPDWCVVESESYDGDIRERPVAESLDVEYGDIEDPLFARDVSESSRARLAHYSVKEYLLSNRILQSKAKHFHLQESREHGYISKLFDLYHVLQWQRGEAII